MSRLVEVAAGVALELLAFVLGAIGILIYWPCSVFVAVVDFGRDFVQQANGNPVGAFRALYRDICRSIQYRVKP